jgi:hypothetical protein
LGAKLYFENERGTQLDLQSLDTCYYSDITNLGVEYDASYISIGDKFVRDYLNPKQSELGFDLNFFRPNVYEKIQTVSNFILAAEQLILVYKPELESSIEYRREVEMVSYLKKTGTSGYIAYTVSLRPLSLFYYKKQTKFYIESVDGEMRFDYRWPVRFNDYADRTVTIPSGSHTDLAFDLEIRGYCKNPKIEVVTNNKVTYSLTFPVELDTGEKLLYSSVDEDLQVDFVDVDGNSTNIFNKFDLNDTVFFKIPKSGAIVKFSADTAVFNTIIFTTYNFFKVV